MALDEKRYKQAILTLIPLFIKILKSREKILPKAVLKQYLSSILEKREVFLESAYRFGTPQYFFDEPSLSCK